MKSRINLYSPDLAPRLDLLSLSSLLLAWGATLSILLLTWAGVAYYESNANQALVKQKQAQQVLNSSISELKKALANRKPDEGLTRSLSMRQQELANRQLLVEELSEREQIKQQGFAGLLDSLAEKNSHDIWLETIQVSENSMLLEGRLKEPEAMPKWLQRLGNTSSFTGRTFDSARIYREEEYLRFELSMSRTQQSAEPGGQQ